MKWTLSRKERPAYLFSYAPWLDLTENSLIQSDSKLTVMHDRKNFTIMDNKFFGNGKFCSDF
jgi:hypothetical protein